MNDAERDFFGKCLALPHPDIHTTAIVEAYPLVIRSPLRNPTPEAEVAAKTTAEQEGIFARRVRIWPLYLSSC